MRQSSLLIIFLVVFIDLVGFGIVIPILPYYAKSYGATGWTLGWLMAVYSLMQFFFAPIWGRVSDYIGRRPVILVSLLGTSVSLAFLGLAGSLQWLFIARTFAGICSANISTAYAYVTDITSEKDRAKGMGMIGAGFGMGFIFGPAIAGILLRYGYSFPMYVASFMALCNFIFAVFKLEEPDLTAEMRSNNRFKRFDLENLRATLSDGRVRIATISFLLTTFAVAQMETVFAIYMAARYGYDADSAAFVLALMGLIMAIVQGILIGKLVPKYGEVKLIIFATAFTAVSLVLFGLSPAVGISLITLGFLALGHGILHPTLSSLASMGTTSQNRGGVMGVFQSAGSLARVLAPPCAGWLYDRVSWRSPFFAGAIVLTVAFTAVGFWQWSNSKRSVARQPV